MKLMVVFLMLSISLPVLTDALERGREDACMGSMEREFSRFCESVAVVHYSGPGSSRSVVMDIPDGCDVRIGGEGKDAYSIRGTLGNGASVVRYMEVPAVMLLFEGELETGRNVLLVRSVILDGRPAAEVVRT